MQIKQDKKIRQQQTIKKIQYQNLESTEKQSESAQYESGRHSIQSTKTSKYFVSFDFRFRSQQPYEITSLLSENDIQQIDQFFEDEVIYQKKVLKRDIIFRSGCLNRKFIKHATQIIYKFCLEPNELTFCSFLGELSRTEQPIFQQFKQHSEYYTLNQSLQDLFYRKQHTFLIHTFDWSICHLTFVCCLLIYWMQIEIQDSLQDEQPLRNSLRKQFFAKSKITFKQNIFYIASSYAQQRSQQININQPVLLLLYSFLNILKREPCINIVEISLTQYKLINDLKLFRRIKRKQKQFQSTINQVIFEQQLRKYQFENKLINDQHKTQRLLKLICLHNLVSCPLIKYYQLDEHKDSRSHYQEKKDFFCLWVLNIILNQCQRKKKDSVYNAALYILIFMSILRKMKNQCNLEGISYLLPIIANVKIHIPKVWDYAKKRRPEIQEKLAEYENKLMKKEYKTEELSQSYVILWGQTIYQMSKKMEKYVGGKQRIQIEYHRKFNEQFLVHFLHYRRNLQNQYQQRIEKYDRNKQIGDSFNMYLLDRYIPKMYKKQNFVDEWDKFMRRAEKVNNNISRNFYDGFLDYCFVGATTAFQKIQI